MSRPKRLRNNLFASVSKCANVFDMKFLNKISYKSLKGWVINLILFAVLFNGISYWRELKLLPADGHYQAPSLSLPQLNGPRFVASSLMGKKTVVYFFAPWCQVCHWSMGNLEDFYQSERDSTQVIAVALSYDSRNEVADFVAQKRLSFPVLLGTNELMSEYRINGFPSYYVLDEKGLIIAKSQGYSTEFGLKLRAMLYKITGGMTTDTADCVSVVRLLHVWIIRAASALRGDPSNVL